MSSSGGPDSSLLDKIPDSEWFFCFPISVAVYCITFLGIIHPLLWISVMRTYRSELFVFMYVLIGFWSFLSLALLYAIITESACIYSFWIWYTLVFSLVMAGMMFLLFCGFCVLGMRRKSVVALIGLIYYIVTCYFAIVVNKQRKQVFGVKSYDCNECSANRLARFHELQSLPNVTLALVTFNTTITQPPTTMTTTMTWTTAMTTPPRMMLHVTQHTIDPMRTAALAALLVASTPDEPITINPDAPTRTWIVDPVRRANPMDLDSSAPSTLPPPDMDRLSAIAKLSELLVNSNECRKPRKPPHGRYQSTGRRGSTLRLTLRCDMGYRESSVTTECKYNWWDRPIPQCRKRRPPPPLPLPGGGCIMPGYPEHGEYTVADHARARPGDRIAGDNVILLVTCDEPYRAVDPYVICVEGRWRHAPPSCQKHCKLVFDPTVEYKCLKVFKDEFLACGSWQPQGAVVAAACRSGHAHRGPFRYMRCRGEAWDHVVSCLPNANFTR